MQSCSASQPPYGAAASRQMPTAVQRSLPRPHIPPFLLLSALHSEPCLLCQHRIYSCSAPGSSLPHLIPTWPCRQHPPPSPPPMEQHHISSKSFRATFLAEQLHLLHPHLIWGGKQRLWGANLAANPCRERQECCESSKPSVSCRSCQHRASIPWERHCKTPSQNPALCLPGNFPSFLSPPPSAPNPSNPSSFFVYKPNANSKIRISCEGREFPL